LDFATLSLAFGMVTFVGTHLLLSHPLRAGMIRQFGQGGFMVAYSLVSLVTFSWAAISFGQAAAAPQLWDGAGAGAMGAGVRAYGGGHSLVPCLGSLAIRRFPAFDVSDLSTRLPKGCSR